MFRTVPLSIIRSYSLYTQQWYISHSFVDSFRAGSGWNSILILLLLESCLQTCMTYTTAECTVNNCLWWTEELSETCSVSFPKWIWEVSACGWFNYKGQRKLSRYSDWLQVGRLKDCCSILRMGKRFLSHPKPPDRLCSPDSLLYNAYRGLFLRA
jgi:hypothetical protein